MGDTGGGVIGNAGGVTSTNYRRSTGSARGEARRRELLERVTDDLAANGLVDFSLRRAARAADATHKVLLYHFDGVEDLLTQAVLALRTRRVDRGLASALDGPPGRPLSDRIQGLWPVLTGPESAVLDQAIGLAMYDSPNYAQLASTASQQYVPTLLALCPDGWANERKVEVAELILATLQGFLVEWRTSGDSAGIDAGYRALVRALDAEVAADEVRPAAGSIDGGSAST